MEFNYQIRNGYSYFINECLQYGTPVICTNFPSAYESVENGVNGYIVDMNLSNLDIDKIVNKIPKDFVYKEKCTEKDWTKILNKKIERRENIMFKIIAKRDYTDTKPEFIVQGLKKQNKKGAEITAGDIYFIDNKERAKQILESKLATVIEEKEESKEKSNTTKKTTKTKRTTTKTKKKEEK